MPGALTRALVVLSAFLVFPATSAWAQVPPPPQGPQDQPRRPIRPLFGGNDRDRQRGIQSLDLTLSADGTYDDNAAAALQGGFVDPLTTYEGGGFGGGGQATLEYRRGRSDRSFTASATSGVRTFYDSGSENDYTDYTYVHHTFGAGVRTRLSRSTTFNADGRVSYQPYFSLRSFPVFSQPDTTLPPQVGVDYAIDNRQSWRYDTGVGLDQALGRRSRLAFRYGFGYTDFTEDVVEDPETPTEALYRDFANHNVSATYSYDISSRTALTLGYGYNRGNYGNVGRLAEFDQPMQSHNLEVGFRHERRLSPTRRMHFGASIGATYTESPALLEINRENTNGSGGASFGIDLGRSWVLGADYRRGVQFYEGFARPFYYDRVNASVAGYLSSRLRLTLSTGYDTGQVGFSEQRQYDTYLATAALQYALAQNIAVTGSYGYYRYVYDRLVVLPAGIPQEFDRQTVAIGITFWVPVM